MTATIEISLYPLNNDYPSSVVSFLQKLRTIPGVEMSTNGMSTVLIGPYDVLWTGLGSLIEAQASKEESVFVLKIAGGRREYID